MNEMFETKTKRHSTLPVTSSNHVDVPTRELLKSDLELLLPLSRGSDNFPRDFLIGFLEMRIP